MEGDMTPTARSGKEQVTSMVADGSIFAPIGLGMIVALQHGYDPALVIMFGTVAQMAVKQMFRWIVNLGKVYGWKWVQALTMGVAAALLVGSPLSPIACQTASRVAQLQADGLTLQDSYLLLKELKPENDREAFILATGVATIAVRASTEYLRTYPDVDPDVRDGIARARHEILDQARIARDFIKSDQGTEAQFRSALKGVARVCVDLVDLLPNRIAERLKPLLSLVEVIR